ncbi:histone deacetylase complex subunit SAP30/SAP30-like protein [Artemisia annua]|uniref:Histone deacetylase complex subunit SAP30/SAP30-like protein n=1 Tax=Artemisia annua TaxID=35608 RepID=A0A2U1LZI4_ARTAN|nr:histone deacetylase complex subunit SAP30/SAP30-like protein [Artemisia annua]
MLEPELYSSRVFSPFREESGDEELSVLPRHTKVIVTGNNRTKSVLVGLQGVVKKAVGLGGWHWLVLKNGIEVKLQRNALSVLEPPTGLEEDDEYEFEISDSESDVNEFSSATEFNKLDKPRVRYAKPWGPSPAVRSVSRNGCREAQSNMNACYPGNIHSSPTKEQLVNAVHKHFASQKVSEMEAIMEFINAAKRRKSGRSQRDRS